MRGGSRECRPPPLCGKKKNLWKKDEKGRGEVGGKEKAYFRTGNMKCSCLEGKKNEGKKNIGRG